MIKGGIDPAIVAAGGLKQNIQFAAAAMDGDLVERGRDQRQDPRRLDGRGATAQKRPTS
jgi:hypothetical protein